MNRAASSAASRARCTRQGTLTLLLLLAAITAAACDPASSEPATEVTDQPAPQADIQIYHVRGEVVALPEPDDATPRIRIRHEAIPNFVNDLGETVGMEAMTMPFQLREGVPLDQVAVGDKVRFQYAVDWSRYRSQIVAIEKLPPDTSLDFAAVSDHAAAGADIPAPAE